MNALARYLADHDLSTVEFAAQAGCHRTQIWRAKKGTRLPGLDLALRIETATNGAVPASAWRSTHGAPPVSKSSPPGRVERKGNKRVLSARSGSKSPRKSSDIGARKGAAR